MTEEVFNRAAAVKAAPSAAWLFSNSIGPRIFLSPETGEGTGTGDDDTRTDDQDQTDNGETDDKGDGAPGEKTDDKQKKSSLSDEAAALLKDVMKEKGKRKEAEDLLTAANARLKEFEGIDPAAVRELLAAQAEADQKAAEKAGDFERAKTMMIDAHKTETTKLNDKIAELNDLLKGAQTTINDLTIGAAFTNSAFIADELVLPPAKARRIYGAHFEIEDGNVVGYDKPKGAAERTKLVGGTGETLSFTEALKKLVDADPDRDTLLKSKLKTGASSKTESEKATPKTAELRGVARIAEALGSDPRFASKNK